MSLVGADPIRSDPAAPDSRGALPIAIHGNSVEGIAHRNA